MNPCLLIPLIVAAVLLPVATGGNPLRIWRDTGCLAICLGGACAAIYLIADLARNQP